MSLGVELIIISIILSLSRSTYIAPKVMVRNAQALARRQFGGTTGRALLQPGVPRCAERTKQQSETTNARDFNISQVSLSAFELREKKKKIQVIGTYKYSFYHSFPLQ